MFFKIYNCDHSEQFGFNKHTVGRFTLYLDSGWVQKKINNAIIFFKGYSDRDICSEVKNLCKCPVPKFKGNYCVLICKEDTITVTSDIDRSFPLSYNQGTGCLTNLPINGSKIWADSYAVLGTELNVNYFNIDFRTSKKISIDECVQNISDILDEKVLGFKKLKESGYKPKIFLSGGVDTLLLYALLKSHKVNFELVNYEYFDYTDFVIEHIKSIKNNYWAYKQLHHWKEKTVLATGSCGDEFFMRGPNTIAVWLGSRNKHINDLNLGYHRFHFSKEKNQKVFNKDYSIYQTLSSEKVNNEIKCILNNDHQHWHLENTLTWTPYKDLRITENILRLSDENLIKQFEDAAVTKMLISKYDDSLLNLLSNEKNDLQNQRNLKSLILS